MTRQARRLYVGNIPFGITEVFWGGRHKEGGGTGLGEGRIRNTAPFRGWGFGNADGRAACLERGLEDRPVHLSSPKPFPGPLPPPPKPSPVLQMPPLSPTPPKPSFSPPKKTLFRKKTPYFHISDPPYFPIGGAQSLPPTTSRPPFPPKPPHFPQRKGLSPTSPPAFSRRCSPSPQSPHPPGGGHNSASLFSLLPFFSFFCAPPPF